jgi:hypothetical protein
MSYIDTWLAEAKQTWDFYLTEQLDRIAKAGTSVRPFDADQLIRVLATQDQLALFISASETIDSDTDDPHRALFLKALKAGEQLTWIRGTDEDATARRDIVRCILAALQSTERDLRREVTV